VNLINNILSEEPITIIGCGPGGREYLIPIALEYINKADVLIGSRRLLSLYMNTNKKAIEITADISSLLKDIEVLICNRTKIAVLVTGDTGVASMSAPIIRNFGKDSCRCIPGISSIQLACARLCIDWSSAEIINAHKGHPIITDETIQSKETVIILCGNRATWQWIKSTAKYLDQTHDGYRCANLGQENEMISTLSYADCETLPEGGGNAVLIWHRKDSEN
jgi:precorrin-6y C5,15-methyltransferase (decarboxylating) CbiE subunit